MILGQKEEPMSIDIMLKRTFIEPLCEPLKGLSSSASISLSGQMHEQVHEQML